MAGITQKGQKRLIFNEVSQFTNADGSGFVKKIRKTNKQTKATTTATTIKNKRK